MELSTIRDFLELLNKNFENIYQIIKVVKFCSSYWIDFFLILKFLP